MSVEKRVQIQNQLGMHARAATKFVQLANRHNSKVFVEKDGQNVNGKSIMGVLMLVAAKGSFISIKCEGADETVVLDALAKLVNDKFGED